ncbi:MAG TPA: hypothetical protein VGS21_05310 [Acidimicrobiales bacterium]|nr:hypothetical protein [Acidimicrobiales bacterium]
MTAGCELKPAGIRDKNLQLLLLGVAVLLGFVNIAVAFSGKHLGRRIASCVLVAAYLVVGVVILWFSQFCFTF